jgi:hypothetical protein
MNNINGNVMMPSKSLTARSLAVDTPGRIAADDTPESIMNATVRIGLWGYAREWHICLGQDCPPAFSRILGPENAAEMTNFVT